MPAAAFQPFDVVGLGVSTLDLLMPVEQFPGGESVERAAGSLLEGGGPVATALVCLSRLGSRAAMIDRLGDDWRGNLILEQLRREGVDTRGISVEPGRSSSIAAILVRNDDGARSIVYAPGDAGEIDPARLPVPLLRGAKILHLNGRHLDACLALTPKAKALGVRVSFDGGAHRYRRELDPLIESADICIVAREFAAACSRTPELAAGAARLLALGPTVVVITGGAEGSWVFHRNGERFHQPAFPVRPVDTTGAGDAYHGAFLHGLAHDYLLTDCARLATAVAAMSTLKLGGRAALPTLPQALAFLVEQGAPLEPRPLP